MFPCVDTRFPEGLARCVEAAHDRRVEHGAEESRAWAGVEFVGLAEPDRIDCISFAGAARPIATGSQGRADGVEGDFTERPGVDPAGFEFDGGDVEPAARTMGGGDASE